MSLKDGEMQAVSALGAALLSGVLFVGILWFTKKAPEQHIKLGQMTMIEASLAYKTSPTKQPQKHFRTPDPVHKEGVSHDENKHVEPKKPDDKDKKPAKVDPKDPFKNFKHPNDQDSDDPVGPVTMPAVGDLRGSINGNAEFSKGDPYLGALLADMQFQAPSIAKTGDDVPIGCFLLQPDGKIRDFVFKKTSHNDIQLAAEAALKRLKKARDEKPQEVPTRLLRLAGQYICITFNLK